jgi:23S rRNA (guanosine2251-2'-O)-methyltransferase
MRKQTMNELNRLSVDEFKTAPKLPIILVLDNIRSQNNIGSIFRTADAFRLESIYLCGITATPPHREIHKTALGATESVDWKYFPSTLDAIEELQIMDYHVLAIEQTHNGIFLTNFVPAAMDKLAIVFGNEVNGIAEEVINKAHVCIEIPQYGTKHSLNISVSVGIVLWDVFTKLKVFYNKM